MDNSKLVANITSYKESESVFDEDKERMLSKCLKRLDYIQKEMTAMRNRNITRKCIVIGITGVSRAGKSSVTDLIISKLQCNATIIREDNYWVAQNLRPRVLVNGKFKTNYDDYECVDWNRIHSALVDLRRRYDVIILEGYSIFENDAIMKLVDKLVYIDIPYEVAWDRRKRTKPLAQDEFDNVVWKYHLGRLPKLEKYSYLRLCGTEDLNTNSRKIIDMLSSTDIEYIPYEETVENTAPQDSIECLNNLMTGVRNNLIPIIDNLNVIGDTGESTQTKLDNLIEFLNSGKIWRSLGQNGSSNWVPQALSFGSPLNITIFLNDGQLYKFSALFLANASGANPSALVGFTVSDTSFFDFNTLWFNSTTPALSFSFNSLNSVTLGIESQFIAMNTGSVTLILTPNSVNATVFLEHYVLETQLPFESETTIKK